MPGTVATPGWVRPGGPAKPSRGMTEVSPDGGAPSPARMVREGLRPLMPRLWRYGLVLSGRRDVAEDLVQAACLRALERAGQFEPGTRLDRWLFSILHSIWLNEVRSRRIREGQGFVDAETALAVDGVAVLDTRIETAQVLRRVAALPEAQRETVFLAYGEGLSYREVAETLGVPIGTVMSRLAAARARLAESCGREAGEDRAGTSVSGSSVP